MWVSLPATCACQACVQSVAETPACTSVFRSLSRTSWALVTSLEAAASSHPHGLGSDFSQDLAWGRGIQIPTIGDTDLVTPTQFGAL